MTSNRPTSRRTRSMAHELAPLAVTSTEQDYARAFEAPRLGDHAVDLALTRRCAMR